MPFIELTGGQCYLQYYEIAKTHIMTGDILLLFYSQLKEHGSYYINIASSH